jgi:hypothetical protein
MEIDKEIKKCGLSNEAQATFGVMAVESIKLAPFVKLDYRHLLESGGSVTIIIVLWRVHELGHFLQNG